MADLNMVDALNQAMAYELEHDSAVSATLAAAGYNRAPIDDEDLGPSMSQRSAMQGSRLTLR